MSNTPKDYADSGIFSSLILTRAKLARNFVLLGGLVCLLSAGAFGQSASDPALDLRDYGLVSGARGQYWGTCWLHGACAAMESNLKFTGNWTARMGTADPNLAEYYMDKYNGFTRRGANPAQGEETHETSSWRSGQDWPWEGTNTDQELWPLGEGVWPAGRQTGIIVHCGGDYSMVAAHVSNYGGAVDETNNTSNLDWYPIENRRRDFGYGPDDGIYQNPENHGLAPHVYFMPRHVEWHTWGASLTDTQKRQRIKEAVVNYGAVATCEKYGDGSPPDTFLGDWTDTGSGQTYGVYVCTYEADPTHANAIIGWNDNFTYGGYTGAWLVKDSSHSRRYNWRMYDDLHMAKYPTMGGVTFRDVVENPYDDIYSHSLHGWRYDTSGGTTTVNAAANRFVAKQGERLESVGIYTLGDNVTYTVRIHKGNLDGAPVREETGSFERPGFHIVDLTKALGLKEDDVFFVVVELSGGGYAFDASFITHVFMGGEGTEGGDIPPRPWDTWSTADVGESFFKNVLGEWVDFQDYDAFALLDTDDTERSWNFAVNAYAIIPEPATMILTAVGALGLLIKRRRKS